MSRKPHHPSCALSLDAAESADEDLIGYKPPKCTCRALRKAERLEGSRRRYGASGVRIHERAVSLGDGNYWTPPLSGSRS